MVPTDTRNLSSPCITSHADGDIMPLAFSKGTLVRLCSRAMASTFAGPSIAARQVLSANCAADFESARAAAEVEAKAAARAKSMNLRVGIILVKTVARDWAIVPEHLNSPNYNTPLGRARKRRVRWGAR